MTPDLDKGIPRVTNQADVTQRLRALDARLRQTGVSALFLFGSIARGTADGHSDVDLLAEFEPGARLGWDFAGLPAVLSQVMGRPVDLTTRTALHPLHRADIQREAVRVYP